MKNAHHYQLIAQAIRYLQAHHTEQPSLEDIAAQVHLSKFHFQRLFRQWAGISPKQFLQYLTIEQAKQSLRRGQSTLQTAYEAGLSGNGRLHDLFVKLEACSPGAYKQGGRGLQISHHRIDTPFGEALIAETKKGICHLSFSEETKRAEDFLQSDYPQAVFQNVLGPNAEKVQQYFLSWEIPASSISLDLKGTPFQLQVWKALLSIPSGQLLSYGDVAHRIKRPKASRAVGTAIGSNPVGYLIPCHRVIRQNGELGGYRWQAERKRAIHVFELAQFEQHT
ncbi:MAG: methylated-DNA--[protein]-cysteine S-methyltransferase [Bacteroidota bacterium]